MAIAFRPPLTLRVVGKDPSGVAIRAHIYLALALTVVPCAQTDWPVPKGPQSAITQKTWTDSFKLPLTTVKPPYTEYNWPNPKGPRPIVIDWADTFKLPLIAVPPPPNQFDWPVTRSVRALQLSWSDSFKLPLTTVRPPYTEYNWPVPRAPRWTVDFQVQQAAQQVAAASPFFLADWPNPGRGAPQLALTWTDAFKLPLTTVAPPYTQYDWPNPRPYLRSIDLVNFTSSGCSILRGPVYPATITFDYPNPRGAQRVALFWSDAFKLPLTTVRAPYLQTDWPNPAGYRRVVDFGFVKSTDPKIQPPTGTPIGQPSWPVPRGPAPIPLQFAGRFSLPLITTRPPSTNYDWPVTRSRPEEATLRNWSGRFTLPLTTVRPAGRQLDWPNPKGYRTSQVGFAGQPYGLFATPSVSSHYEIFGSSEVVFYSAYIVKPEGNVPDEVNLLAVASSEVATEVSLNLVADEEVPTNVNLIQDPNT